MRVQRRRKSFATLSLPHCRCFSFAIFRRFSMPRAAQQAQTCHTPALITLAITVIIADCATPPDATPDATPLLLFTPLPLFRCHCHAYADAITPPAADAGCRHVTLSRLLMILLSPLFSFRHCLLYAMLMLPYAG